MAAVRSQSQGRDCTWSNKVAYHKSLTIVEPGLEVYIYFRKCVQSSNVLFNPRLKFVARTSMFWKEEFISANRLNFKHVLWNNLETAFRSAVATAVTSAWVVLRRTAGPWRGKVTWGPRIRTAWRDIQAWPAPPATGVFSAGVGLKDKRNGGSGLSGLCKLIIV